MLSGLLLILLPLFLGYLLTIKNAAWLDAINRGVSLLVYVILFIMGMGLAQIEELGAKLLPMAGTIAAMFACLSLGNWLALALVARLMGERGRDGDGAPVNWLALLKDSGLLVGAVALGTLVGLLWTLDVGTWSEYALALLLLLIGIQLRAAGMSLRQLLLNRLGLAIAGAVLLSSLAVGALLSPWLGLTPWQGMGVMSGFGWYSLSGILVSDALGAQWGAMVFFTDLARELVALALIPVLMHRSRPLAIGYAGATAMDFSLPALQKSGGVDCVPIAVVSGFALSLATPVLMALLLA
ncbi:lysine exporter LysO family protein [Gallaecimonas sp. GXIMD4217]|uniref:lysine exporter LysO family protein n=1 Tax=Gallaecimonas sp. GXIMD4217 TaxID=3131927 RepID=UPI00311AE89B